MGVKLREKKLKSGKVSFYLDIIQEGKRSYEFLKIQISGAKRLSKEDREKKELAEKIRSEREYDLIVRENGIENRKKKQANFLVFFNGFTREKGFRNYLASYNHLSKFVDGKSVSFAEVTAEFILNFQSYLLSHVGNNSAIIYINCLSTVLKQAVIEKIIPTNPFIYIPKSKRLKIIESKRDFLTFEEIELLANTPTDIPLQSQQIFLFACFTGLRWSDVSNLQWSQIIKLPMDGKPQYVIDYRQIKTDGLEVLPLSDQGLKLFDTRKQHAEEYEVASKYVFPYAKNETAKGDRSQTVKRHIRKWCKAAGIEKKINFHTSRHTFATLMLTYGADIYTVSKLLGHKQVTTTTPYTKIIDKKKTQAVNNLPSF